MLPHKHIPVPSRRVSNSPISHVHLLFCILAWHRERRGNFECETRPYEWAYNVMKDIQFKSNQAVYKSAAHTPVRQSIFFCYPTARKQVTLVWLLFDGAFTVTRSRQDKTNTVSHIIFNI